MEAGTQGWGLGLGQKLLLQEDESRDGGGAEARARVSNSLGLTFDTGMKGWDVLWTPPPPLLAPLSGS